LTNINIAKAMASSQRWRSAVGRSSASSIRILRAVNGFGPLEPISSSRRI
jgi:hypothetical protein